MRRIQHKQNLRFLDNLHHVAGGARFLPPGTDLSPSSFEF
jgi:hypothetical protein